jgi:protochlorophyllide reductase
VLIKELDLADLDSVNRFASEVKRAKVPVDCLTCNAGVQFTDSKTPYRTKQGYELTVGTNHIGHFALATQLLDVLDKSDYARLVFVGSGVHNPEEPGGEVGSKATLGDMKGLAAGFVGENSMVDGGPYDGDKAYKDSKLCNVAISLEFARRLQERGSKITCNVMNPGLIPTSG